MAGRDFDAVPTWNGDPGTFQTFEVACKWYEKTLKDTERRGAAARVWSRLTGPAKSVVRHLSPDEFDVSNGLSKLLQVLRSSPLQTLPIPDSFSKLERWHQLRRKEGESIPELIVREDDLFRELQASLLRSRARVEKIASSTTPSTPASPSSAKATEKKEEEPAADGAGSAEPVKEPGGDDEVHRHLGFFEDELRGFRLLKAAGLTNDQRMQVLTLTANVVSFDRIRQALRALYDEEDPSAKHARRKGVWYASEDWEEDVLWQGGGDDWLWEDWAWDDETSYWAEWSEWPSDAGWQGEDGADVAGTEPPVEGAPGEEEEALVVQEQEAAVLAAEAAKTLQEARQAIQKVRAARGYYPLGGKKGGLSGHAAKGKSSAKGLGKGKGKSSGKPSGKGGCLICGRFGHFFRDCPNRHAKGAGKLGKKGANMWMDQVYHMYFIDAPAENLPETEPMEPILDRIVEPTDADLEKQNLQFHQVDPLLTIPDKFEQALVLSLETAMMAAVDGTPGFILDTGATENAVGVKTLQTMIQRTGVQHMVTLDDRPVFKFGDGLSLRACSKVTLFGTGLGEVHFYTLDGDHRPQTHNAENTPALLGSKFLREARATISYDRLCLWFQDRRSTLWATELLQTQSGHLMIPVAGRLLDLTSFRLKVEQEHGVRLPHAATCLMDILFTPGALEALRDAQSKQPGCSKKIEDSLEEGSDMSSAWGTESAEQVLAAFPFGKHAVEPIHVVDRPQLSQRLRDLSAAPFDDPRQSGYPCWTKHTPGNKRENQYATWMACGVCGLRLRYETKGSRGKTRTAGPTVAVVQEAMDELALEFPTGEVNERMCLGKIREVQGRRMVQNEKVTLETFMEKKAGYTGPRGISMSPPTLFQCKGATAKARALTPPTCDARRSGSRSSDAAVAAQNGKSTPQESVPRAELEEAWMTIQDQENKVAALKMRLKEALGEDAAKDSDLDDAENMSTDDSGQRGVERHFGTEPAATSPTQGLQERSRGFTGAVRRQLHAAGATYFASLLCTTTILLNSIEPANLLEINGARANGHFGAGAGNFGITFDGYYQETGWKVDKKDVATTLVAKVAEAKPAFLWIAPAVRGESSSWEVGESPGARRNRQRGQRRALESARILSEAACRSIHEGNEIAWETPMDMSYWKDSLAEQNIRKAATACGRPLHVLIVEGCHYPKTQGAHGKRWRILTTSHQLAAVLRRCRCPGHKEHDVITESVAFPVTMVKDILEGIQWELRLQGRDLQQELQEFMLQPADESPIYAMTSGALPALAPNGAKLKQVKENMLRLHRAAGHTSFENLARLLQRRGCPEWAVKMARELTCVDCAEVRHQHGPPAASAEPPPALWETLGMDVFEYEYKRNGTRTKAKFLLMIDRASRFVMTHFLHEYPAEEAWEPSTADIKRAVVKTWMAANPSPRWLYTDAAAYFTSREMIDFASRSGLGLMTAPAEAHYLMGVEERAIQVMKRTVEKLELEELNLDIGALFTLAAHGHNSFVHSATGYSPFQWARGWQREDAPPVGLDPRKAFSKVLAHRATAEAAFLKADAGIKLSKLSNSVARPVQRYQAGDLCMLWRARMNRQRGGWTGPLRVLLQEGTTVWLATGTTLVRAKLNQVRPTTEREKLVSSTQGTTVYQNAVGLEILLRGYRGKHFLDATSENPGLEIEEDLSPADRLVEPEAPRVGGEKDRWVVTETMVIRKHLVPRLSLFTPDRTKDCPVPDVGLSGRRRTVLQRPGGANIVLDNYKTEERPRRSLMERWCGETQFERAGRTLPEEIEQRAPQQRGSLPEVRESRPEQPSSPPEQRGPAAGARRGLEASSSSVSGPPVKKERRSELPPDQDMAEIPVPQPALRSQVLAEEAPEAEPETPVPPQGTLQGVLPAQPDFLEEEHASAAPYSTTDEESSDEELRPDVPQTEQAHYSVPPEKYACYACEISLTERDLKKITKRPRKATAWLSQKMIEKSREVHWRSLTQPQKEEYDEAMSIEVSNVIRERAARALTAQEICDLDYNKIMNMRWVLTRKASGAPKARLVVLGYQAHNLLEVETAAPTLSCTGRNMLLTAAANSGMILETGDVTSAFLQTFESLEKENLVVWAPIELAAMFGADPADSGMAMKLTKAFYGLAHAPRKWHETVLKALRETGWQQLRADRCLFALRDGSGRLCALAGLHVDDFLLAGLPGNKLYLDSKKALQERFRFGKWEQATGEGFTFAGCRVRQTEAGIQLDQEEYVNDWVQEIPLDHQRAKQLKSKATPKEIGDLRAALGTLSWKASQTGPQFQAEVSLKLSEVPMATVNTLVSVNKLVREVRRTASQRILFPCWGQPWQSISAMVWADASQANRPNKSSTVAFVGCMGPRAILEGEEVSLALVAWRSSKCPRESLGSNGSEVQAITIGEDEVFLLRAMWYEIHGGEISRYTLAEELKQHTSGGLVMDSKGIFDAMTRNVSALHGLRSSRAGFELTVSVQQAVALGTQLRWVNGTAQLADGLTKDNAGARRGFLEFLARGQRWSVVHDPSFTAGKKLTKRQLQQKLKDQENFFVGALKAFAASSHYPWFDLDPMPYDDIEPRNLKEVLGI
ncbi:GIP [Symbiodinium natans]|uniref:GIP protein n=1 Tax=Symbiodinium natans TaxID=878477 RepID=A0A812IZW0_9DINO|nr:GIP [Symbiodinium natans]